MRPGARFVAIAVDMLCHCGQQLQKRLLQRPLDPALTQPVDFGKSGVEDFVVQFELQGIDAGA